MTRLLPTVAVAEIVPYSRPQPEENAPDWFLGMFNWRDLQVPLLSFEVINGEAKTGVNPRSRIAVLNNTGLSDELPFIAIEAQDIPRLARVNPEEISEVEGAQKKSFESMHVTLAGEEAVIPNVTALEQAYLDFFKTKS